MYHLQNLFGTLLLIFLLKTSLISGQLYQRLPETTKGPNYNCTRTARYDPHCTFENVILSETDLEWQPDTYDADLIDIIHFANSRIPVFSNTICTHFPSLKELHVRGQHVKKIQYNAFEKCKVLARIHFEDNEIQEVDPSTFAFGSIHRIYLDGNRIRQLTCWFANLVNLTVLSVSNNNLTHFNPDLIKNNHNLQILDLSSNEMSDIPVEAILHLRPKHLEVFNVDDNELSCVRTVQIIKLLHNHGIQSNVTKQKSRFYNQKTVLDGYTCNGDIEWMASNHRKDDGNVKNTMHNILDKEDKIHTRISETEMNMKKIYDDVMHHINEQNEMIKKIRPECVQRSEKWL